MRMTSQQYRQIIANGGARKRASRGTCAPVPGGPSALEARFAQHIKALQLPAPVTEFRFHPERKWRFDFAWPKLRIAVEIEGGVLSQGRHVRPQGFTNDCEKYNHASQLGWRVLRFTGADVRSGSAIQLVQQMLTVRS